MYNGHFVGDSYCIELFLLKQKLTYNQLSICHIALKNWIGRSSVISEGLTPCATRMIQPLSQPLSDLSPMLAIQTRVVSNKLWIDAVKQANLQDLPWAQNNVSMPCLQELRVLWQPRGSLLKANQALKNLSNSMSCMKMHLIKSIKSWPWGKQLNERMKVFPREMS